MKELGMEENAGSVTAFFEAIASFRTEAGSYVFVEGVEVGLRPSRAGDCVYLLKIRLVREREGLSSESLSELCRIADDCKTTLFLEVEPSGSLTARQLADWYWRFGFRGDLTEMIREPTE